LDSWSRKQSGKFKEKKMMMKKSRGRRVEEAPKCFSCPVL